jgi:hypothetical protein
VLIEWFIQISGDVQTILLRKPLSGVLFFLVGAVSGILLSVLVFITCIEKTPNEFVQYRDPTTGQLVTVPYVRTASSPKSPAGPTSPSPSPSPAPIANTTISAPAAPVEVQPRSRSNKQTSNSNKKGQ